MIFKKVLSWKITDTYVVFMLCMIFGYWLFCSEHNSFFTFFSPQHQLHTAVRVSSPLCHFVCRMKMKFILNVLNVWLVDDFDLRLLKMCNQLMNMAIKCFEFEFRVHRQLFHCSEDETFWVGTFCNWTTTFLLRHVQNTLSTDFVALVYTPDIARVNKHRFYPCLEQICHNFDRQSSNVFNRLKIAKTACFA